MTDMAQSTRALTPAVPLARGIGVAAVLGVLAAAPLFISQYGLSVGLNLFMTIALAESWLILSGLTGYISLGHAVFFGLCAYIMAVCFDAVPFWAAIPLGGIAAAMLALVLGFPALNVRGPYFVILTFGLAELVKFVVVTIESAVGNFGRIMIDVPDITVLYELMFGLAAAAFALVALVQRSRFGAALRAIREDESAAETIGINVRFAKVAAFVLSAIIPGMVGAVMAMRSAYFEPMVAFSPMVSFTIVTTAMIGGSDAPMGPVLGAVLLVGASELLWAHAPEVYNILLGVVLIVFVLRVPEGLYGRVVAWLARHQQRQAL
jgi:branched-chain amino acid transport system permease protein